MNDSARPAPQPPASHYADLPVRSFLERLASAEPAPGGGSAAALTGAEAAALVAMVARTTLRKAAYRGVYDQMSAIVKQADQLRDRLLSYIDLDALVYSRFVAARRLPQNNEAEQAAREAAIQNALADAVSIPLQTLDACTQVLALAQQVSRYGNVNAAGDTLVAALLAQAAMAGALRNGKENARGLADAALAGAAQDGLDEQAAWAAQALAQIQETLALGD